MTVAGGGTSAAYDAFAPHYDAFTSASDYGAWGRETLADARRHGLREDELGAAFAGMKRSLAAGGVAIFDLNSLLAYRTTHRQRFGCPVCGGAAGR